MPGGQKIKKKKKQKKYCNKFNKYSKKGPHQKKNLEKHLSLELRQCKAEVDSVKMDLQVYAANHHIEYL